MNEEGLKAYHKISTNIADQDEKIWRQTAAKKCLKKEIERLEEETKSYQLQIATFKKDPLFEKHEESARLIQDNIKEHIQLHKLLSIAIQAKSNEIERQEKDLKTWDEKYAGVLSELEEAYQIKKKLIESTNPDFKKMMEIRAAQKIAEVELMKLKASSERRQRSKRQHQMIQQKIFHTTIVNFVKAAQRMKQYEEVRVRLKDLEEKKKNMVTNMFETQEALRKLKVRPTQIPSGMFARKVSNFQHPGLLNINERKRMIESPFEMNKEKKLHLEPKIPTNRMEEKKTVGKQELNFPVTPRKTPFLAPNRLNITSNQTISLPPLKTILARQRSRMETSFNKSFDTSFNKTHNSLVSSQPEKISDSTPKSSQEEKQQKINQIFKQPQNADKTIKERSPIKISKNLNKSSDFLKNLKFTSQPSKFQIPIAKQTNQVNQKTSILKNQTEKRKLNESFEDSELDSSFRKKEKNVNFANPIQQNIEIHETTTFSSEASRELTTSEGEKNSEMDMNEFLSSNDDEYHKGNVSLDFGEADNTQPVGKSPSMLSMPIFGGKNDTEITSFGFSFGGPSKSTDMWDLFG